MQHNPTSADRDRGRHAVVGIIHEQQRFLVIRRSEWVKAPGLICFPGGGIEAGEDVATAVRRELMEELSLAVDVHEHLWTSETRWGTRLEWVRCSRRGAQSPQPNPAEVAEYLWLSAEDMVSRSDLLGSMPDFLSEYASGRFSPWLPPQ
jgi:8-oxo-dGTP pyrophosphatase MutT (NUDIX family)